MNTAELRSEPGAPEFHRRFVGALKAMLGRPPETGIVDEPANLPRAPMAGAMVWVRSISRLAVFVDGAWLRTDTGAAL